MSVIQNTLYLTTRGASVHKEGQTLRIEAEGETRLSVPIHRLESVCAFGRVTITPSALALCWRRQVSVHYHTEDGRLLAQLLGSGDTRYLLRRAQYASADCPSAAVDLARRFAAGKLQNARTNLLRAGRESEDEADRAALAQGAGELARLIKRLGGVRLPSEEVGLREALDPIRGLEGIGTRTYYGVFSHALKRQRGDFRFTKRTRRPPRDRINCLLSFAYALTRNDCLSALTAAGLDPYVGWLHATRAGRPACALDLMEEFRPCMAERLALTLVNRRQIDPGHFRPREGGAVELTDRGRRLVIEAWQRRKQAETRHPLFKGSVRVGQLFSIQAKLLARTLRGDLPEYIPYIPK